MVKQLIRIKKSMEIIEVLLVFVTSRLISSIHMPTHRPEREINPQTFVYERDILAEAQVSLKNAWRTMEADGGQIFY